MCVSTSNKGSFDVDQGWDEDVTQLYALLGLHIKASAEDIRIAYRKLARLWHPDRHYGDENAKRKFQQIQSAYEVLSDPCKREQYDLGLLEHLDVEDYLKRYQELILTPIGLGMAMCAFAPSLGNFPNQSQLLTAA